MIKNNLREIRMKEYMLNITDFADFLSTDRRTYGNWERNYSRPNLEQAFQLAKKLNKEITEIWFME